MERFTTTRAPFSVNKSTKTDSSVFAEHESVLVLGQNGLRLVRWFEDCRQTNFGTYCQQKRLSVGRLATTSAGVNVINRSPSCDILIVCVVDGYDPGVPQL
jgi:hypothetical protein